MGKRKHRKYYSTNTKRERNTRSPTDAATDGEWESLYEDPDLLFSYRRLSEALSEAQMVANQKSRETRQPSQELLDLRSANRILDEHPQLVRYLHAITERQEALQYARERTDDLSTFAAPSGTRSSQAVYNQVNMGGWAGDTNKPIGVPNPRSLRDWSDRSTWVSIAKGKLRRWVERADVAIVPDDEERPYPHKTLQAIDDLLNQPNEYRDSYRSLIGPVVEDILVLDRGVIEKNMTLGTRIPVGLYYQDGSSIKIYPQWSGDPKEPRYLYDPGGQGMQKKALRNDEAIVIIENISTWRLGYSRVQMLQDTIQADIEATQSAIHTVKQKPPPHIIQLPNASPTQLDRVRARYDSEFQGRKEVMFMGGPANMNVKSLVYSLRDQQWMEWNIYLARKIATIFGISPQEFGITYDVNRATAETQADISENTGYIPLLLLLEEYLNREFVFDFAPKLRGDRANIKALNLRLIFPDVSEVARMLHIERIVQIANTSLGGLPSMTLNQVLAMRGESPVPGGDTFYIKTAVGAVSWLSYQTGSGDVTSPDTGGQIGGQDPAGGPSDNGDDTTPPGGDGDSGGGSGGSEPGGGSSEVDSPAPGGAESEVVRHLRHTWYDGRRPGKAWGPATDRRYARRLASAIIEPKEEGNIT